MSTQTAVRVKETIPLWLAVAITVLVSIPFGLWLGKWSFTLWVAFIVWAEYFQYGAKPSAIKIILPSYTYGAVVTGITLFLVQLFQFLPSVLVPGDLALGSSSRLVWVSWSTRCAGQKFSKRDRWPSSTALPCV